MGHSVTFQLKDIDISLDLKANGNDSQPTCDRFLGPKLKLLDNGLEIHTNGIKFMDLQLKFKDIHLFLEHSPAKLKDIRAILVDIPFILVLFPFISRPTCSIFVLFQAILRCLVNILHLI